MENHINISSNESVANPIEATPTSATKVIYSTPQLTIHGQLERITQQSNSTPAGPPSPVGGDF